MIHEAAIFYTVDDVPWWTRCAIDDEGQQDNSIQRALLGMEAKNAVDGLVNEMRNIQTIPKDFDIESNSKDLKKEIEIQLAPLARSEYWWIKKFEYDNMINRLNAAGEE